MVERRSVYKNWGANVFMSADVKPRSLDKNSVTNPFADEREVRKFIESAQHLNIASPNETSRYSKTFRFFIHGIPICVEAKKEKVDALLTFAQSTGIRKQIFMDHFQANFADIINPHDHIPVSKNRHSLDFHFSKKAIEPQDRIYSLTLREALKNMDRII
jgi:hypothetical protein